MMEKICGARFCNMLDQAKPYLLTVGLQFGGAGTFIIIKATLNYGMSRFVLAVYRNVIAALALAPFALIFERCYSFYMLFTNKSSFHFSVMNINC